jgi:thymidylate synthase
MDERGSQIRKLMDLMVVIEDPYTDMIPHGTDWNEEGLKSIQNS